MNAVQCPLNSIVLNLEKSHRSELKIKFAVDRQWKDYRIFCILTRIAYDYQLHVCQKCGCVTKRIQSLQIDGCDYDNNTKKKLYLHDE